ncbi:hypothetical protein ERX46_07895 [Brumimicrobium glaciale]|uniref:T9SS type A sorting domain-containing protein n=1 Tax=Brumimicrobium glaciale TaxID=200475 RepID=A0A4V1WFP1_9FLAO|nr:hypothetical protein [Brumimicrobium glaciale]RYM33876.1 hypothetical protein ERX46_07895 [Brumimicrobium glaciale]
MKKRVKLILILITTCFAFSCKKQGCMDEYAANYDASAKKEIEGFCFYKTPIAGDYIPYHGPNTTTLTAIDRGFYEVFLHSSGWTEKWDCDKKAVFYGNNKNQLISAGDVFMIFINLPPFTEKLKQDENNFYDGHGWLGVGFPKFFPDTIVWEATGSQWPAFNLSTSVGFSERSLIQSAAPLYGQNYIFDVSPAPTADSIALDIYGQRNKLSKVISADLSNHTFSQNEIESLGRGNAVIRAVSMKYDVQANGGQMYYFLNQKIDTLQVMIK